VEGGEVKSRPVLRYHGGKWKLAPWIISHFPEHRVYVEPYGGGASVLMQKPRTYAEVYNDKWDTVVNVFQVLRDPEKSEQLRKLLELTPFSRTEFNEAFRSNPKTKADVEDARLTILRSFAGFGSASTNGEYATGFRCNSNRSGTTPAHDWANYPSHVRGFVERLRGVVIENREAIDVIRQHEGRKTLFYVDPPYPHSTRNMNRGNAAYAVEMSDDQHRELSDVLHSVEGMVVISGYACELYDVELYGNFHRVERKHLADGAKVRTECLWMNDAAFNLRPNPKLENCDALVQ
jgi:DNA adenine methylase